MARSPEAGGRRATKERAMRYVHTCYRVLDLDKSIEFYTDKLGLELARRVPIGDDATNAFFAVPGDPEPRLELTLNHDQEEPYELGTGYSHLPPPPHDPAPPV